MILCLELQYTAITTIGGVVSLRKNKVQKNEECLSNSDDLSDLFQHSPRVRTVQFSSSDTLRMAFYGWKGSVRIRI
jgi:hypothetical protein